jgi:hypothetical protein
MKRSEETIFRMTFPFVCANMNSEGTGVAGASAFDGGKSAATRTLLPHPTLTGTDSNARATVPVLRNINRLRNETEVQENVIRRFAATRSRARPTKKLIFVSFARLRRATDRRVRGARGPQLAVNKMVCSASYGARSYPSVTRAVITITEL